MNGYSLLLENSKTILTYLCNVTTDNLVKTSKTLELEKTCKGF